MRYVFDHYPPGEYPKLYPLPVENYKKGFRIFRIANQVVFIAGLILLLGMYIWISGGGEIRDRVPVLYCLIQFMLLIWIGLSEFNQFKLMRKSDKRTIRMAELQPRNMFDFVSPLIFGVVFLLLIVAIVLAVLWGEKKVLTNYKLLGIIGPNILMVVIAGRMFYGKKLNPYQHSQDRVRELDVLLKSYLAVSALLSMFSIMYAVFDKFEILDYRPILLSLFVQLNALMSVGITLFSLRLEDINFEVYKVSSST